jgi:glycosyltransferase involved in cell wall biosynthesis
MTPHAPPTDRNNFRLLIIDPSYATRTGHNHAVNSLLLSEARRRGIESYVFAHTSLAASSEIIPAFRPTAYGYSPQDSIDALLHSHAIGKAFAEDLAAYVQPRLKPADILFAHTLHNPLMHGFAAWLASLSAPQDICVRLGLNLPPDFRQRRQDVASWNAHQYAFAFRLLTAVAPATRFYAETRELEALFLSLGAQPTAHRRLPPQPRDRLIYFIPGEIRAEKGHEFLINGVLQIANRHPQWMDKVRFRFTSIGMPESVATFLARYPELFEVLPETTISVERYWELIADADVVGCTYDPADYGMRASGIFLEALALGKPVLVSRHTSVAAEVAADCHAYGTVVDFGNVDSLAAGLELLIESYPKFQRHAAAVADRFQRELSASSFFDWLLAR